MKNIWRRSTNEAARNRPRPLRRGPAPGLHRRRDRRHEGAVRRDPGGGGGLLAHLRTHQRTDTWFFPEDFQRWDHLAQSGILPLLDENQYVCAAAILQKDLSLPDPPVYTRMAADEGPWVLSASTVSEFLEAALTYEAIWQLKYSAEEYYWLTDEELATVQAKLTKRPAILKNWMEMEVTFYSNRPDNLVVIMDVGDQYQALYGGATQESYAALLEVMEGLGEPI